MNFKLKNMNRQKSYFVKFVFLIFSLLSFYQATACRYTVREIGYTDLGNTDFYLYMFVNDDTEKEVLEGFQQIGYAVLLDSNVKISIVNIDRETEHPALKYINLKNRKRDLLEILFISPFGKAKLISKQISFEKDEFWEMMESLVNSDIRAKMNAELVKSYGALLLVEGSNPIENARVREIAKKAIEEILLITKSMAKPVDLPVRLYEIPYEKRGSEEILLWSLGVSLLDEAPSLVTLFGRGRMMGKALKGNEINTKEVFKLLSIIGADCECGLEKKWILGSTVPLRWSMNTRSILTKELGFDVENPMVKSEMSQILSINLPVIEKISTTTYVNSLERLEASNQNQDFDNEFSTNTIILYSFLSLVLLIGSIVGILFYRKRY